MCQCADATRDGYAYLDWAQQYFGECVYTPAQKISFFMGFTSIFFWIFAQFPQVYRNFKAKSAEGISGWFLLQWFLGDTCNLVGCVLTNSLPSQTGTAIYYVFMDFVLGGQWLWYSIVRPKYFLSPLQHAKHVSQKFPEHITGDNGQKIVVAEHSPLVVNNEPKVLPARPKSKQQVYAWMGIAGLLLMPQYVLFASSSSSSSSSSASRMSSYASPGRSLLDDVCTDTSDWTDDEFLAGYVIGCISAVMYLGSRLPQLYKNFTRKSTEGLSYLLFTFAVLGNTTYGLSIFLYSVDAQFLEQRLPWLVGSVGVLFLDFTALLQFMRYRKNTVLMMNQLKHEAVSPVSDEDVHV